MAPTQPPDPPQTSLTRRMAGDYGEDETVLVTRKNEFFVSSSSGKRTLDIFKAEYKMRGYEDSNKRIKIMCREDTDEYLRSTEASAIMKEQKRSLEASYKQGQGSDYTASSSGGHDGPSQEGPSSVGGSSQGNVNYANERDGRRGGGRGGFSHGSLGQGYNSGGEQFRQYESVEIERVVDTEDETSRDNIPFYLKVEYLDQEREDMKTATTADSFYRTNSETTKCANCGHFGHRLIDCEEKPSKT